MSLTSALQSALGGLQINQTAISLAAANVSKAGSPDHSRRILQQEATPDPLAGVRLTDITRVVNDGLRRDLERQTAELGRSGVEQDYLSSLADAFGITAGIVPLSTLASRFSDAWRGFEASPESATDARNVVTLGNEFAAQVRGLAAAVERADNDIRADTLRSVAALNGYLAQIQEINAAIVRAKTLGDSTAEFADTRDGLMRKVAEFVDVRSFERDNGAITVFTTAGLSLVDNEAVTLSYDGADITVSGQPGSLNTLFREGRIAGLLAMRANGSPAAPGGDPGAEVIRKLRERLDGLVAEFLGPAAGSFADAYDGAATATGELAGGFFTGGDRFDFAVNASLLDGSTKLKQASAQPVADAIADGSRGFAAGGLALVSTSYAGMAAGIVVALADDGAIVAARQADGEAIHLATLTRYRATVGVNVDEELANMQMLQNAYAASARVFEVVNSLFEILNDLGR